MPTNLADAFVEIYSAEVLNTYQDRGFVLPSFTRSAAVMGEKLYWHKLDKMASGDVTKDDFTAHTLAAQSHGFVSIDTVNREVPSALHSLEMLKTNVDFRQGYIANQLALLGRFADQQIVTEFDANKNATVLGPGSGTGLSIAHIHQLRESFDEAYIPNDGQRYVIVPPKVWSQLLQIEEFVNADYVGQDMLPYAGMGLQAKQFQTFNWVQYKDVPKAGTVSSCMAWHRECMGHGVTKEPETTITYENIYSAWVIVTRMSMNGKVIDDTGVYAFDVDEDQAVAA